MLTFWKLNHVQTLDWNDNGNDIAVWIVIVATKATEFRFSTFICTNSKQRKVVLSKCITAERLTLHTSSQFDVRLESGQTCLREGMSVIGKNALRTFLEAQEHCSFSYASLDQVLTHTDTVNLNEQSETETETYDLGYLSS